jgi:hypothetical protein
MMRTSYLLFMHNLQSPEGADLCADTTAGAVLFNGKVRVDQFEGPLCTDRYAASAVSTNIPMYFEH